MSSRQLEDQRERENDQKIADYIGLAYDEYVSLEATLEENESDDGVGYSTMVVFELPLPLEIASKIVGLDGDRVHLPPGFFDEEDHE